MRRLVPLFLAVGTLATLGAAAPRFARHAHPDFSGTWNLDVAKSEGPMTPTSATLKVTQTDKSVTVDRTVSAQGMTQSRKSVYSLDGSTSKNTVNAMGTDVEFSSTVEWSGEVMVIKTTAPLGPGFSSTEKWTLSDDKKTLVIAGDAVIGPQTMSSKQTFAKQ
jgi:hypothetical protein